MRGELRFGKETRHRSWDWIPDALKLLFQIGIVCFLAFVFVWYFGQKTSNIGDSMNPVLKNGDVVLVDRFRYDASSPRRGDIIVFKPNGNEHLHSYIKRIIGLPGETIQIKDDAIYINGKKLEEKYIRIKKVSSIISTKPYGGVEQPDFLNEETDYNNI